MLFHSLKHIDLHQEQGLQRDKRPTYIVIYVSLTYSLIGLTNTLLTWRPSWQPARGWCVVVSSLLWTADRCPVSRSRWKVSAQGGRGAGGWETWGACTGSAGCRGNSGARWGPQGHPRRTHCSLTTWDPGGPRCGGAAPSVNCALSTLLAIPATSAGDCHDEAKKSKTLIQYFVENTAKSSLNLTIVLGGLNTSRLSFTFSNTLRVQCLFLKLTMSWF